MAGSTGPPSRWPLLPARVTPCDDAPAARGGGLPGTSSARSEARALFCGTASPAPLRFPFGPSSRVNRLANIYLTVQIEHARLEPGAAAAPASGPRGSRTATGPGHRGPPLLGSPAPPPPRQANFAFPLRFACRALTVSLTASGPSGANAAFTLAQHRACPWGGDFLPPARGVTGFHAGWTLPSALRLLGRFFFFNPLMILYNSVGSMVL